MCFHSPAYIPRSEIAGSYGNSVFNVYENWLTQNGPHHVPSPLATVQTFSLPILTLWILAVLLGVKCLLNLLLPSTLPRATAIRGARDEQWTGHGWPCPRGGPAPTIDLGIQGVVNPWTRQEQEHYDDLKQGLSGRAGVMVPKLLHLEDQV